MGTRIYPAVGFAPLKGKLRWVCNAFVYPKHLNILKELKGRFNLREK